MKGVNPKFVDRTLIEVIARLRIAIFFRRVFDGLNNFFRLHHPLQFGTNDLVYGTSADGKLREFAESSGGRTLTDLPKPPELSWREFTLRTLDEASTSGQMVHFDLTYVQDLPEVLSGMGRFADTITAVELRYIQENWEIFQRIVRFYYQGKEVPAPW